MLLPNRKKQTVLDAFIKARHGRRAETALMSYALDLEVHEDIASIYRTLWVMEKGGLR